MSAIYAGLLRHGLTTLGGGLLTGGALTEDQLSQAIGAIITLVGIIASVIKNRRGKQAVSE